MAKYLPIISLKGLVVRDCIIQKAINQIVKKVGYVVKLLKKTQKEYMFVPNGFLFTTKSLKRASVIISSIKIKVIVLGTI
jgi:hypothetical protein